MRSLYGWTCWLAVNLPLLWQLILQNPLLPPLAGGLLLVSFNMAFGLYLGNSFADAYANEVSRANRYLSDQNQELVDCNSDLLKQVKVHGPMAERRPVKGEQAANSGS